MKALYKISMMFLILLTSLQPQKATAQATVNYQIFYDNLSPYGSWVSSPSYGYVWIPRVSGGFTPYHTNGYWAYTDYGWTWVSNYSWGWAPYHYGRWYYDSYYGWAWVPDNVWGPAWVSWRNSADYYGWAPLSPGASLTAYNNTPSYWTFVRHRDFGRTNITNYYINSTSNTNILRNTTIINRIRRDESSNMIYTIGPDRTEVQKRTGKSFASVKIKDRNAPGQKSSSRELHLYRPQIKSSASGKQPRPKNITDRKDVKPQPKVQPSAIPQRDRKETAPKVAPPKNSRPDREMERPREVAPKIREPKIDRPAKEVERPKQTVPSPQPPRINPPVNNPSPPVRMQEPPMNRPSNPTQRPNIDRPVPQGKRDGGPGGKIKS